MEFQKSSLYFLDADFRLGLEPSTDTENQNIETLISLITYMEIHRHKLHMLACQARIWSLGELESLDRLFYFDRNQMTTILATIRHRKLIS